jgi:hypothetical protein
MAEKMVALHRDDTLAEDLGRLGLAFLRAEFSAQAVLRALAAATLRAPD